MMRFFQNWWGWVLDYCYVAYWTVRGIVRPGDPAQYAAGKYPQAAPIVLVPGVYESWQFMKPIADHMYEEGYAVHALTGLGYNTGKIPDMAQVVSEYITAHNLNQVVVIAHSKGGLIAKLAMMNGAAGARIKHIIALNTPFLGSKYAYLFLIPSVRTFAPRHKIIRMLAENHIANQHITSIYSQFDPHIPETSFLEGADNNALPMVGHFRPIGNAEVLRMIARIVKERTAGGR